MSYRMLRVWVRVFGGMFRMRIRVFGRMFRMRVRMFGRVFWMRKRVPKHVQHMFKFLLIGLHWIMQRRLLGIVHGSRKYKSLSRRQ